MAKILLTGGAGFIAYHLSHKLHYHGHEVISFDNFNSTYYDNQIKYDRATELKNIGVTVAIGELGQKEGLEHFIDHHKPDVVIHLAAFAAVRESMLQPSQCIKDNILGTQNLINVCEKLGIHKVIYASTSCTMSGNPLPWHEDAPVGHQLNPYGYTKRTNECQFKMSKINQKIGLKFFTVYGPWGRPDMAIFKFADGIVNGTPINIFNYGNMKRDFTYIDDITAGIHIVLSRILHEVFPLDELYNIGRGEQVNLMDFIEHLEVSLGRKSIRNLLPKHPADTQETWSDTTKLQKLGYNPKVSIQEGVKHFTDWYLYYKGINRT